MTEVYKGAPQERPKEERDRLNRRFVAEFAEPHNFLQSESEIREKLGLDFLEYRERLWDNASMGNLEFRDGHRVVLATGRNDSQLIMEGLECPTK